MARRVGSTTEYPELIAVTARNGDDDLSVLKPAVIYVAVTFVAGFALGALRVLVVAPRVGELAAVGIEVPFMLLASFLVARWVLRRFAPGASHGRRLAIGAIAFALLMGMEMALSAPRGIGPHEFVASLMTPQGTVGLAAQCLFGLMPLLAGARRHTDQVCKQRVERHATAGRA